MEGSERPTDLAARAKREGSSVPGTPTAAYDKAYYVSLGADSVLRGKKPAHNRLYVQLASSLAPGGRWLDAGCGLGFLAHDLSRRFETVGLDVSSQATQAARHHSQRAGFVTGSVEAMPFQSERFDVVSAIDVLEHLERPEKAIRETYRVLRQGGVLLCQVPNLASWGLRRKGREWFGHRDATHRSLLSEDGWESLLLSAGFEVVDVRFDGLWDPPYLPTIPTFVQLVLFKAGSAALLGLGFRFPKVLGENAIFVARKRPAQIT